MQDSKIDVGADLESDNTQQIQLPWSIKRLILWLILFFLICFVVNALSGFLIAYFNQVNEWGLKIQDIVRFVVTYILMVLVVISIAFLRWQCEKAGLSIMTIWGSQTTPVRYVIFALILGVLLSLIWNWKIVNFDNIPAKHSDVIFYGQVIVNCLLVPFQEELYFRGMLYRILRKRNDSVISTLISALIFSAYHIWGRDLTSLFFTFLYGVVTAFLVERTNSLTASYVCHVIANLVAIVVFQHRNFFIF